MSVYATIADLIAQPGIERARLVELTDEAATGDMDEGKVQGALDRAAGTIDAYLAASYQLPIEPVPPVLVQVCCDLAYYSLWNADAPELVKTRNSDAMAKLRDLAKGLIKLDQGAEQLPARDGVVVIEGGPALFGRDAMRGY